MTVEDGQPVGSEGCTAVLATVPEPVADRIASFLRANGLRCATRPAVLAGSAAVPPTWEVLVPPEDLPIEAQTPKHPVVVEPAAAEPAPEPKLNVLPAQEAVESPPAPGSPAVLCELPWDQAWALSRRLIEAGIPAAVMEAEKPDRERPMQTRVVPVGVRPEDVERAQPFLGGPTPAGSDGAGA